MLKNPLIFSDFYSFIIAIIILSAVYYLAKVLSDRKIKSKKELGIFRSGGLFSIVLVGVIVVILIFPWNTDFEGFDELNRDCYFGCFGIEFSHIYWKWISRSDVESNQ